MLAILQDNEVINVGSPIERRTFVSMDVTFWESEPYYGEKTDLSALFEELDHQPLSADVQEGENGHSQQRLPQQIVGGPIPVAVAEENEQRWPRVNEETNLQVYTRRRQGENTQQGQVIHRQGEQGEDNPVKGEQFDDGQNIDSSSEESTPEGDSLDLPIALRKGTREAASRPINRYGFEHDIGNYVSYAALSPSFKTFVASLQIVIVP